MGDLSYDGRYFWVAYADKVINTLACTIVANPEGRYQHPTVYQTHAGGLSEIVEGDSFADNGILDLGTYSYLLNGFEGQDSWGFAKFKAIQNEKLAAAIFTSNRNEIVTVNVYENSEKGPLLMSKKFKVVDIGYHLLDLGKEISFSANDTIVIGIGFEYNENHKKLPLVYVRDNEYDFIHPTYFATIDHNEFNLIPYADLYNHCLFLFRR